MTRITVRQVVDSTGAWLLRGDPDAVLHGVTTDTRQDCRGRLFLALSGPNFDGNAFAVQAAERGAGALVLRGDAGHVPPEAAELPPDLPVVLHPDPRRALGDLASWHRSRLSIPVVGITGSCGKTTTKGLVLQLLGRHRRVVGSPSSFNNDVGVPLTLLMADETTEVLVVELGTNSPGEIEALCRIARPTAGLITNVGASHLEKLGTVEGVAHEKRALFAALPREGFAVLNLDSPHEDLLRGSTSARVLSISVEGEGDLNAVEPWFHGGGTTFRLSGREVTSPLLGTHNVHNLLAALAVCTGLGIELDDLLPDVPALSGGRQRLERVDAAGVTVFDDTYNANPESARAGVRVLAGLHGHRRRVLVLGEMLELGELAPELHYGVGYDAARAGIDLVVLVGNLCRAAAAGALEGGLRSDRVVHLADVPEAERVVPGLLEAGDVVLVKASRATGLERVVGALRERRTLRGQPARTVREGVS